ncbi:MAG: glycoside hydrolase family 16 protein [Bacteroidota bacterium]
MKTIAIGLLFLLITACSAEKEQPWRLVWSDEFNYEGLPDKNNWRHEEGYIANNELQYYTPRRIENSVVGNGNLMIIGRKEPWDWAGYTSARINTLGKHSWTYGKFEARIKLPEGQGIWPAFWMLGGNIEQIGWPECGEIDIMEHINNEDILYGTLHWHDGKHMQDGGKTPCNLADYHDYAVEWDADSIKWFLDGKQYHQVVIRDSVKSTSEFHKPCYLILNLAIGGSWPGNPDETTIFPDTVFVDWVRVYQK